MRRGGSLHCIATGRTAGALPPVPRQREFPLDSPHRGILWRNLYQQRKLYRLYLFGLPAEAIVSLYPFGLPADQTIWSASATAFPRSRHVCPQPRRTLISFPETCVSETRLPHQFKTGGANNAFSQRVARKTARVSGPRSGFLYVEASKGGFCVCALPWHKTAKRGCAAWLIPPPASCSSPGARRRPSRPPRRASWQHPGTGASATRSGSHS